MKVKDLFLQKFTIVEEKKKKYEKYKELIQEYNQRMNLTGITDDEEIYLKHFYDSLLITELIADNSNKIADIGTGAGFPGIVLAIYYSDKQFYLIEPMKKRCKFLQIVVEELQLQNVKILNKRAEELKKEQYSIVVSRAVAPLNILLELTIPLLEVGGSFIAMKSKNAQDEISNSQHALKELKAEIIKVQEEILPVENSTRINILVKKEMKSPYKYPRNFGQIKKKPL